MLRTFIFVLLSFTFGLHAQDYTQPCRLNLRALSPIIAQYNPFFANHRWDPVTRMELARLSNSRMLMITQDGCKRHHIRLSMILDPREIRPEINFWIAEVKSLMFKVYYGQAEYSAYQAAFEEQIEEKLKIYGLNARFNFPLGTQNFICEIEYDNLRGAKIEIEQIGFIFKEKLLQAVPEQKDKP